MKTIKKLFVVLTVFAMLLASSFSLAACGETPTPTPHTCGHVCPVEGCGKCLDATCTDPACANKCPGHTPVVQPHECGHVCPETDCGKCTDATCTDPVCAEKCPGHTPVVEPHECGHVCPEEDCGKCLDADCTDPVCAEKCPGHEPASLISGWYVETTLAEKQADDDGYLVSVKLTGDISAPTNVASATVSFPADADHGFIAVKYSGTASLKGIGLWGTKDGAASANNGLSAGDVGGWNQQDTSAVGTDFSVFVIKIDTYYVAGQWDIDTVTNLGFSLTGAENDTFTIHAIEVLADKNHNLGTPTPPVVVGDLEVGDMKPGWDGNGFTVTKNGDDQVVTFESTRGYEKVIVQVKNYTDKYKYLYIDFTASADMTIGVWKGNQLSNGHEQFTAGKHYFLIDLSEKSLEAEFTLEFYFDAGLTAGTAYDETRTVTFHEITFSETDPMASTETNSFRTPVGSNLTYSEADKKISYTNSAAEFWRYLDIKLDNHDPDYDVLSINITGYNGLVLGVRVLYEDEIPGAGITAATLDVIPSSAYYSEIKTDQAVELVFYLAAYNIDGSTVTGVQLYCDAPANAGKNGEVEITLNSIAMLKSADLNPATVTLTAQNVTIAAGETPDFQVTLKDAEGATIEGTVITEYRVSGSTDAYAAGLPTAAGTYEVRFYYMGSRTYGYSRTVTATLTITEA